MHMMLFVLMVAALAKAAVLPKDMFEVASPVDPLSERSADIHDWAMVCAYEKAATSFCQRHFGYGCDASGKLKTNKFDHDCSVLCNCINLYPTKNCLIGLTGGTYCLRSLNENETTSQIEDRVDPEPLTLLARSDDTALVAASQPAVVSSVMPPRDWSTEQVARSPQELAPPSKSYHRATICTLQYFISTDCLTASRLQALGYDANVFDNQTQDSIFLNGCLDLFSKIRCSFDKDGRMICEKDNNDEPVVNSRISDTLGLDKQSKSRSGSKQHHNYAMTCDNDSKETEYCKNDGYYCDGNGKLSTGSDGTSNKFCRDNCSCVNIGTRQYHMRDHNGAVYVLDFETIQELYSFDESCARKI